MIFLLFQCTFKAAPDLPPSKVATETLPKREILKSFGELTRNRNFQLVCVCYSFVCGPFFAYGLIASLIYSPFGFAVDQIAMIGAASAIFGVFATVLFGKLLDRTRAYKMSLILFSFSPIFVLFGIIQALKTSNNSLVFPLAMSFEAIALSAVALCMSFSTEVTYPL